MIYSLAKGSMVFMFLTSGAEALTRRSADLGEAPGPAAPGPAVARSRRRLVPTSGVHAVGGSLTDLAPGPAVARSRRRLPATADILDNYLAAKGRAKWGNENDAVNRSANRLALFNAATVLKNTSGYLRQGGALQKEVCSVLKSFDMKLIHSRVSKSDFADFAEGREAPLASAANCAEDLDEYFIAKGRVEMDPNSCEATSRLLKAAKILNDKIIQQKTKVSDIRAALSWYRGTNLEKQISKDAYEGPESSFSIATSRLFELRNAVDCPVPDLRKIMEIAQELIQVHAPAGNLLRKDRQELEGYLNKITGGQ